MTILDCYTELNNDSCSECELLLRKDEIGVQEKVRIYPNPSKGNITIASREKIETIEIISMNGSLVYMNQNPNSIAQLELELQKGIYLLKVQLWDAKVILKKIVIE